MIAMPRIVVDRAACRLRLVVGDDVREYPVAVGSSDSPTRAGEFSVLRMSEEPNWRVPDMPKAGALAGQLIPFGDPRHKIGPRWIKLYAGVGIHATRPERVGHAVSWGCVGMLTQDVLELYERVEVGTPVVIV